MAVGAPALHDEHHQADPRGREQHQPDPAHEPVEGAGPDQQRATTTGRHEPRGAASIVSHEAKKLQKNSTRLRRTGRKALTR